MLVLLAALSAHAEEPVDPFAWLEDVEGEAALATVRKWNAATAEVLEKDPRYRQFYDEALAILTSDARIPTGTIRGKAFEGLWRDATHTRGVWRSTPVDAFMAGEPEWTVLLDVDALEATEQQNWQWSGVTCAAGSDRCLVDLSRGGSDASVRREFDKAARAFVAGGFEIPEAKTEVAWQDPDTLLVGTDRGPGTLTESGYARTIVRWERGTKLEDAPVVFEGAETDVLVAPGVLHHGKQHVTLLWRMVTFFETEIYVLSDAGTPRKLPLPLRSGVAGLFGRELLVTLQEDWTTGGQTYRVGSLVAFDLDSDATRLVLEPPAGGAIEQVAIGKKSIFVQLLDDVVGRLVRLRPSGDGFAQTAVPLPDNGMVSIAAASDTRDDALVTFESLTVPSTLFHVGKKDTVDPVVSLPAFYDATGVVVEQRFATSTDGTKVPYFLMAKADTLANGPAPTLQYGYGGFLASTLPEYFAEEARPQHGGLAGKVWVSRGGVLVLSNIRGGAEYGPEWHEAALLHHRQRAFDDFFAISDDLVATGVTTPAQLGAVGRSNGGLLMGAAMTQRPDTYAAIVCGVPLLDMLRYDKLLAGASWVGEYGDPDDPADRAVLEAYSPYQRVSAGVDYPAMLFYTSTKDDRVHPGHARKMAAKLESLGVPFDYYENIEGGHGGVANKEQFAHRIALEYTHLARHTGLAAPASGAGRAPAAE